VKHQDDQKSSVTALWPDRRKGSRFAAAEDQAHRASAMGPFGALAPAGPEHGVKEG
jgi:hypothetical protein